MATIYAVPHRHLGKELFEYFVCPRPILERYVERHHLYPDTSPDEIIDVENVEIIGDLAKGGHRILVAGSFPGRETDWAIAQSELAAPLGADFAYKGEAVAEIPDGGRRLINSVLGADCGETEIPILELAKVVSFDEKTETVQQLIGHSPYALPKIKRLVLTFKDGTKKVAYENSAGYFEGYQCDIYASKKSAYREWFADMRARAKSDWTATECWECGAVYDEPGHVEPWQMGCERCN